MPTKGKLTVTEKKTPKGKNYTHYELGPPPGEPRSRDLPPPEDPWSDESQAKMRADIEGVIRAMSRWKFR